MKLLERIKSDLIFQLSFEHIDWDYFIKIAQRAQRAEEARIYFQQKRVKNEI